MMKNIEARLKSYQTDMLDMWRPVGATWGRARTAIGTLLMVSEKTLDMVVEVFEKAKQQGKVRYLGVSAHNPKVFRNVLNEYPQFSVIIFPYLFLTKELGGDSLLEAGPGEERGRDRAETVRGRHDLRASSRSRSRARSIRGPACWSRKCSRSRGSRPSFPA